VLNHSSDEHPWFEESKKSKDNPYRNYYFWRPGKDGGPPNNWPSFFGGNAWQYDETTDEYYLHLFSRKQPDLNWENPTLRKELHELMKFWLDKGVDGLRLDVISAISKLTDFPDTDTTDFNETIRKYYANGPRLKQYIAEARQNLWRNYDVITVGEGPGITPLNALDYLDEKDGLNMIFHFGHMFMDQGPGGRFDPIPWNLQDFKQVFKTWDDAFKEKGWGSVFLGNHDFPRMVSRWGDDKEYRENSAKLLITLLLTMRGTPFIFQGDEIGMTNTILSSINQSHDIETINGWREAQKRGITESEFLVAVNYSGRDNARTPMQWNNENHAGFTSGAPWIELNKNKDSINVASQEHDPHSIMNYFRAMTTLRKSHKVLTYGDYLPIETNSEKTFLFFREGEKEKLLIVLNFSSEVINLPDHLIPENALLLVGNYSTSLLASQLRPWEAVVYQCDKI
jgi:oligo-1,6-glucosidase